MGGLTFDAVTKRFNEVAAVNGFDLAVKEGEFVALVGPSGCGKTTSLRILAGLEQATSGRVLVGGRDVTDVPSRDRNLAMVFQSYALYPHMTAAENISFALKLRGMGRAEIEERVRMAADRLGISHLLHRRPKELSGGQRQRVAVARCIVREPAAFLFDEPLSNLDAKLRGSARVEIVKLQKSLGVTTLYVTHDQVEAMTMADRIVLMDGGRIRQVGTPMELYHQPRDLFVASFLGAPPMNLLPGHIRHERGQACFIAEGLSIALPANLQPGEGPATLGLRPEALALGGADGARDVAMAGTVTHVEHLGAETIVEFTPQGAPSLRLVARLAGSPGIGPLEAVALSARQASIHLFDANGHAVSRTHELAAAA